MEKKGLGWIKRDQVMNMSSAQEVALTALVVVGCYTIARWIGAAIMWSVNKFIPDPDPQEEDEA